MKRILTISILALSVLSFIGCDDTVSSSSGIDLSTENGSLDSTNSGDNAIVTAATLDSAIAAIFASMDAASLISVRSRSKKRVKITDTTMNVDTTINGSIGYISQKGSYRLTEDSTATSYSGTLSGSVKTTYYNFSADNVLFFGGENYASISDKYQETEKTYSDDMTMNYNVALKFNGKYTGTFVGSMSMHSIETGSGDPVETVTANLTLKSGDNSFPLTEKDLEEYL